MKKLLVLTLVFCVVLCSMFSPILQDKSYAAGMVTPQIAGGSGYSVGLKEDGTVWVWGFNAYGQLGDGTNTNTSNPKMLNSINNMKAVTSGGSFTLALKGDGTVWGWGANSDYQLGDGTKINRNTPVQVLGISNVKSIAAGTNHSLALKDDGTVWSWGGNSLGQLGDGTTNIRSTPAQIPGLTDVIGIAASYCLSIAVKSDGSVWSWGNNSYGQLGNGTTSNSSTPVQIPGISGVKAVAAGIYNAYALKDDGTVWAWGRNRYGQVGDGTWSNRYTPVQVIGLSNIYAISTKGEHALSLKDDGTVWSWGSNNNGEVGNGTAVSTCIPVQISSLNSIIAIGCGENHSLAVQSNGPVYAWGYNSVGGLGDGTTVGKNIPVKANVNLFMIPSPPSNLAAYGGNSQVSLEWNVVSGAQSYNIKRATTAGGPYTTIITNRTFRYYTDKTVTNGIKYYYIVTAVNAYGESKESNEASATPYVPRPSAPTTLVAFAGNAAVTLNWNTSSGAQYYNIKRSATSGGAYVVAATNVTATTYEDTGLTNGTKYYYIVTAVNTGGESLASNEASATPFCPKPSAPTNLTASKGNTKVTLNWDASLEADNYNVKRSTTAGGPYTTISANINATTYEDTGLTNETNYYYVVTAENAGGESAASNEVSVVPYDPGLITPTNLTALAGKAKVTLNWDAIQGINYYCVKRATTAEGPFTSIATVAAATTYTDMSVAYETNYYYIVTAFNDYGQSEPSSTVSITPHLLLTTPQIAGGFSHTVALRDDGTVWTWGDNAYGQLGNGTYIDSDFPRMLDTISDVKSIAANGDQSLVLKIDGTVWMWGYRYYESSGIGSAPETCTPVQVENLRNVKAIAAGKGHSIALKEDGTVWAWGLNDFGQLGDGTIISRTVPQQVILT